MRLANHLRLERFFVGGHSLGGIVATWIAATHGARRVVVVDQRLSVRAFKPLLKKHETRLRGNRDEFGEALIEEGRALGLEKVPSPHREHLETQRRHANQALVLSLWQRLFTESAEVIDRERAAIVENVTAPYLALHGEELDDEYRAWMASHLPHAEIETWPDAGHWLHHVEPGRFLERAIAFLSKS